MASRKATPRKSAPPPNEAALIRECVKYAQALAAYNAGFKVDPHGDFKHADMLGRAHSALGERALGKITAMSAVTASGLQAKARILPLVVDDGSLAGGGNDDGPTAKFFRSFATELRAFLAPLVEAEWQSRND